MKRRTFLKGTLSSGAVAVAVGAGMLTPQMVMAAWPKGAFEAKGMDNAMNALVGTTGASNSGKIKIKAPDIAENGAVVPIAVTAGHSGIESISLLVEKNGTPLAASFNLAGNAEGYVSTRLKMGKSSKVIALVKAGGKLYSNAKEVKVTIGGCGG